MNYREKSIISVSKSEYLKSIAIANNSLNIPSLILDDKNTILYISQALIKWLDIKYALINKNLITDKLPKFLGLYNKFADKMQIQHTQLIENEKTRTFLETFRDKDEIITLYTTKTPIFDKDGNFIVMHVQFKRFTVARVANLGFKFYGVGNFPIKAEDFENDNLTRPQKMVLYLYARNYSYTEVSTLMSRFGYPISPTMVNKHLNQLKQIFDVRTNEMLRDISLRIGYDVAIPAEFIPEGSHDITGDIFELWVC